MNPATPPIHRSPARVATLLAWLLGSLIACGGGGSPQSPGNAPAFTSQPADLSVSLGLPASFTASASGAPAPSYQWQRGSADIPGATAATYTVAVTTMAEAGATFSVVASNGSGRATSRAAQLTVTPPAVPAAYADLYPALQGILAGYDQGITAAWNGQKSPVSFGGELLTANANRGRQLLGPNVMTAVRLELDRLRALGLQSVTVCMGFPVLYPAFFQFNGDPEDAAALLAFYTSVAAEIRQRNMKLVVESSLLFPGVYSTGSGFNLAGYYATLNVGQLGAAHADMLALLAVQVQPDWINLGSEPDTQATLFGNPTLGTPSGFAALIGQEVARIRAAGSSVPLGAGVGTWQANGGSFLAALAGTGIDYIDLHVYPVNLGFLDRLTQLTDAAQALGKPVAISEAWLSKERDAEFTQYNAATDQTIFSRDSFSFWAPLDQAFLGALVTFAHWKHLLYLSPFWTKFLHAYIDFGAAQGLTPAQVTTLADQAASVALQAGAVSSTGAYYRNALR